MVIQLAVKCCAEKLLQSFPHLPLRRAAYTQIYVFRLFPVSLIGVVVDNQFRAQQS
jgi:hypothetical protein